MGYSNIKRLVDVVLSFLGLIISLPVTIPVTILLFIANSGKPFFIQPRPGKNERVFKLIKFKTMNERKDEQGCLLPDKERLTPIGRFVRGTSLDELPQLINVLKGDMSLIGPRPLLVQYLPLYNDEQRKRHNVRPGITGWAQVNGRNTISWEKKFEYDVWYVNHFTPATDIKIILLTIRKVFKSEGINERGQATMSAFKGSGNNVR
jgi:undecaprenyl phosphate N,N'-diacetylbacillosamine 1-phosphate transferase